MVVFVSLICVSYKYKYTPVIYFQIRNEPHACFVAGILATVGSFVSLIAYRQDVEAPQSALPSNALQLANSVGFLEFRRDLQNVDRRSKVNTFSWGSRSSRCGSAIQSEGSGSSCSHT